MLHSTKASIIASCRGLDAHSATCRLPRPAGDLGTENKKSASDCCQLGVTRVCIARNHFRVIKKKIKNTIISSPFPLLRASSATRELPTCQKLRRRRPKQKVGAPVPILADSAAPEPFLCFLSCVLQFVSLSCAAVTLFDGSTIPVLSPTLGRSVCVSASGPECAGSLRNRSGRRGSALAGGETSLPKKGKRKLFIMVRGPQRSRCLPLPHPCMDPGH